jgi:hypothetical protein
MREGGASGVRFLSEARAAGVGTAFLLIANPRATSASVVGREPWLSKPANPSSASPMTAQNRTLTSTYTTTLHTTNTPYPNKLRTASSA